MQKYGSLNVMAMVPWTCSTRFLMRNDVTFCVFNVSDDTYPTMQQQFLDITRSNDGRIADDVVSWGTA